MSTSRLSELLGPARILLRPWGPLAFGLLGWALTAPFSTAPLAMGLCWWGVALLLWCIQLERPWLEVLPFPPLTVLALHLFLRWELGGMLLLLCHRGNGDVQVWIDHVANALPINALFTTGFVAAAAINRTWLSQQQPPVPAESRKHSSGFTSKKLVLLGAMTGVIAIGYALVGYFGGTLDRGASYLQWAGRFWRPDTLFSATIRLRDLYFVILPWLLWSWRRSPWVTWGFLMPTGFSLAATALLGGRGLLLYPAILLLGGLWLAGTRPRILRWLITGATIAALAVIGLMPMLRNSDAFLQSKGTDLGARLQAIQKADINLGSASSMALIARDLYAWSDPYLFKEPGLSQPPAGTKRFNNLLYLWVPRAWMPDRPEINDGHLIAKEIMGKPNEGVVEGRHVWFPGISFGADLYWRFRWPGVVLGSTALGLLYALLCRAWYSFADLNRSTSSALIALYPATFLQGPPLRSVMETAWNWLYEFPKYVLILAALTLIIEAISQLWTQKAHAPEN